MDIGEQVQAAPPQAAHVWLCLRDEEAAGSNPATPTQVTGHSPTQAVAYFYAVQQQSTATPCASAVHTAHVRAGVMVSDARWAIPVAYVVRAAV